jgi:16S rRNA (guanine(966)-N(2))-methyltransferase RsmD
MRIIGGSARGRHLAPLRGSDIRPTPDRVREALFSILLSRCGSLAGLRVLDLFAGTGAMALEALSRGATSAVLVDEGAQSARLIPANLRLCGMEGRAAFLRTEVLAALPRLAKDAPFDLVFLDPPYRRGLALPVLEALAGLHLLRPGGVVCAETDRREQLPESAGTLVLFDRRDYGSTSIHLFSQPAAEESMQ